ncbi:hypothetical protein PV08_09251 [Exophiala spinifera]|uniref:Uncharacterized protein n=1 Tax=Exophiala spinifera TaxID=91928 RepID=A0A0D1ZG82_9EURO|nr:uncharacterized protein PV08_09251 [Exophiala spinifera]KIW11977.1 hypothetical protein PV08_09251 [Exophiala spinifera]
MHTKTQVDQQANATKLPLSSQVACALLLIRAKPHHLSIEGLATSPFRGFDSTSYWKSAHQASERERLVLVDEVAKLEKELSMLRGEAIVKPLDVDGSAGRNDLDKLCGQEQLDKSISDNTGHTAHDKDNASHWTNFSDRQYLLRGVFSLKHNLRLQKPDCERLSAAIRTVTATLCHYSAPTGPEHAAQKFSPEILPVDQQRNILEHAYPFVIQGLSLLSQATGDDGQFVVSAVPDVVKLFKTILCRLHTSVQDTVVQRKDTSAPSSKSRRGVNEPLLMSVDCFNQCRSTSKMLTRMFLLLDLSQDVHSETFEGFLCALLDHVGSLLSLLVFSNADHEPSSDIGILPPNGFKGTPHSNLEVAIETAKVEGPHVISVLREAIDFLEGNVKVMSERSQLLFTSRKATDVRGLRRALEEKLQKTLLRGVFGDDDASFNGGLCRHDHLSEPDVESLMNEMSPDANTSEWFIGQLWEHLGWDILSGHNA